MMDPRFPFNDGPPRFRNPPLLNRPPFGDGSDINMMPGFPPNVPVPQIDPNKELWVETLTAEGKPYYYHSMTRETVWNKPKEGSIQIINQNELALLTARGPIPGTRFPKPIDAGLLSEDGRPTAGGLLPNPDIPPNVMPVVMMPPPISVVPPQKFPGLLTMPNVITPLEINQQLSSEWRDHRAPDGRLYYYNVRTMETTWNKPNDQSQNDQTADEFKQQEEEDVKVEDKPQLTESQKKQRPVANEAVPGTPWCIVWTGDDKVFFYNPTTKVSSWTKPDDLAGRTDVKDLLADPPFKRRLKILGNVEKKNGELEPADADEDDEDEPSSKKQKIEATEDSDAPVEETLTPEMKNIRFKELLTELKVSAFSTWEKELPRICFDKRYTLLNAKERKLAFDEYTRGRAEEERKERKQAILKTKTEFKELLAEARVLNKSSFSDFASKYGKDQRFKAVDKMRERENLFNEFINENKNKKIKESKEQLEKIKNDFMNLLAEKKCEKYSKWSHVKEKISHDSRYSTVQISQREVFYEEYYKSKKETKRENTNTKEEDAEEAKKRRIEESMKAREVAVEREKAEMSRAMDSEREKFRKDEAKQHFKALLTDMVRTSDSTWSDTKRQLKKDNRWSLASLLATSDKERYFDEHIELLHKKKRNEFKQLLSETSNIELTSTWKEVRKLIKTDPRYSKFSSSDRKREREFEDFLKMKLSEARQDFHQLLQETKLISHKTSSLMRSNSQHYDDILSILREDKRYLVLKPFQDERKSMIRDYIDELHRRGSPPPPTASDHIRRGPPKP